MEITIVNIYALSVCTPNFIKHTLLDVRTQTKHSDGERCQYSPITNRWVTQTIKPNKETLQLNDITDLMEMTDIYRFPFHPASDNMHSSQQAMELSPKQITF
jgi:hypothetical protein